METTSYLDVFSFENYKMVLCSSSRNQSSGVTGSLIQVRPVLHQVPVSLWWLHSAGMVQKFTPIIESLTDMQQHSSGKDETQGTLSLHPLFLPARHQLQILHLSYWLLFPDCWSLSITWSHKTRSLVQNYLQLTSPKCFIFWIDQRRMLQYLQWRSRHMAWRMTMLACQSFHHYGSNWNISRTWWIAVKFVQTLWCPEDEMQLPIWWAHEICSSATMTFTFVVSEYPNLWKDGHGI